MNFNDIDIGKLIRDIVNLSIVNIFSFLLMILEVFLFFDSKQCKGSLKKCLHKHMKQKHTLIADSKKDIF